MPSRWDSEPHSRKRSGRTPFLHHFQGGKKSPPEDATYRPHNISPSLGLRRGRKGVPCCPQTPQLPAPSSPEAVATAAIVASALLAKAPGGYSSDCRELGSAQLLRPQVPWIRKLGQAPGIGGEDGARANQRPPRVPREPRANARSNRAPGAIRWRRRQPQPQPLTHARCHLPPHPPHCARESGACQSGWAELPHWGPRAARPRSCRRSGGCP